MDQRTIVDRANVAADALIGTCITMEHADPAHAERWAARAVQVEAEQQQLPVTCVEIAAMAQRWEMERVSIQTRRQLGSAS